MANNGSKPADFGYQSITPTSPPGYISASNPLSPVGNGSSYNRFASGPSPQELSHARIPTVPEDEPVQPSYFPHQSQAFGYNPAAQAPGASLRAPERGYNSGPQSPGSSETFSPSTHNRSYSQATIYDPTERYGLGEDDNAPNRYGRRPLLHAPGVGSFEQSTEALNKGAASIQSGQSKRSRYDNDFQPESCRSTGSFYHGATNWLALTIVVISIFSTVFSGIFLGIALRAPRYGRAIQSRGNMTASTANVLTQLFAKLIELSFVTSFTTFLGQVLSRRAFSRASRGITLSEMSMRNWIMQPGSMITHYESVRYAALTFLGAVSLTVAILATLYSTAASALVTPVLRFGAWEETVLHGMVKTSFANPMHLADSCQTPIAAITDSLAGATCLTIDSAAQGFHNYQQYMSAWAQVVHSGNGTDNQVYRPKPVGLFLTNTTINGSWIHTIDTKAASKQFNRVINNVTLAFPHVGVLQAARDPKSDILQPEDLDGLGTYNIRASLPSPYINTLCANVAAEDIKDLVYSATTNKTLNITTDLPLGYTYDFDWKAFETLKTPLDDVFGWSPTNRPPIFYKYPVPFNTLLNNTATWGRDSVYLLGNGPTDMNTTKNNEYFLCKSKGGLTPLCSTYYSVGAIGGQMSSRCEDATDGLAYIKGNSSRVETTSLDWFNVATTAFNSLSLNNGVMDGAASNARLLSQLMLQNRELNPALPSPAEALSVMVGSTLIMGAQDSPFVEFWNYSSTTLDGEYQSFNASIQAQQYASGGSAGYQRGFVLVLMAVFLLNVFVLIYLIVHRGLVTDFSEPPNLFSLSINSPPNKLMRGSCGAGPEGSQYNIKWGVEMEQNHLYITDKDNGTHPVYGHKHGSSARAEALLSFKDLFRRGRKWNKLPAQSEGVELGQTTAYGPTTIYATQERYGSGPHMEQDVYNEQDGPPAKGQMKESNLSRMYSKIAKRKSAL